MSQVFRRAALLAALAGSTGFAAAIPASAAPVALATLKCAISMSTSYSYDSLTGVTTYTVNAGGGSCLGDLKGTRIVDVVSGTGTSTGFGPGSGCPTPTTSDFTMTLVLNLTSSASGVTNTVTEVLTAPGLNNLPGTQPVTVTNPATAASSPASFSYRIYKNCASGNDSTFFIGTIPV
jgi:hypothetical protein